MRLKFAMICVWVLFFLLTLEIVYSAITITRGSSSTGKDDGPIDVLLQKSLQLLNSNELESAKENLDQILRLNPNHVDALQLMGVALLKANDHKSAIPYLEKALSTKGKVTLTVIPNYIEALRLDNRLEDARKFGYQVIESKAFPLSTLPCQFFVNLGNVERSLENNQQAYDMLVKGIDCDPSSITGWSLLVELLVKLRMYEESEYFLSKAITQYHPNYYYFYYLLGNTYHLQKKLIPAVNTYLKAETLNPDFLPIKANLAAAYQGLGRSGDAIYYYEMILPLMPHDGGIRNNYGALLGTMNRKEEEIYWLEEALKREPDMDHAMINLAGHYQDEGLLDKAKNYLLRAENVTGETKSLIRLRYSLMLTPVSFSYRNMLSERYRIISNLRTILNDPPVAPVELDTVLDRIHFYLQYHGFNDRFFQEAIGNVYSYHIKDLGNIHPLLVNSFLQRFLTSEKRNQTLLRSIHEQEYAINRELLVGSLLPTLDQIDLSSSSSAVATAAASSSLSMVDNNPLVSLGRPKARIGFISKFFGIFEPHGMLLDGIMKYLPRNQFEIICLIVARTDMKPASPTILESCHEVYEVSLVYQNALQMVANLKSLDVLIFADVVSEPINHFLVFNRMAPIQVGFLVHLFSCFLICPSLCLFPLFLYLLFCRLRLVLCFRCFCLSFR
jgi:tetratricopeptide (TPR) repeat protein